MNTAKPENQGQRPHNLHLTCREALQVSGVSEVLSFDETGVLLRTALGTLSVGGEELRVTHLDTDHGDVQVTGKINAMLYVDQVGKKQGIKGLFR